MQSTVQTRSILLFSEECLKTVPHISDIGIFSSILSRVALSISRSTLLGFCFPLDILIIGALRLLNLFSPWREDLERADAD